jgi:hypothetical protein
LPKRQRQLTTLILRKLLASSSQAIAGTLDTLIKRLETLRDEKVTSDPDCIEELLESEEMDGDLLDEILEPDRMDNPVGQEADTIDRKKIQDEIKVLQGLADWARSIGVDTKSRTLLKGLEIGFEQMVRLGAERKALIFTESRRTQDYLKAFLESNGYQGQVALFNGSNAGPEVTGIYERWVQTNAGSGRVSGSRAVDMRTALIEAFRDEGTILIATEAASEGVNLQFCSLVVNYDLPWNPQRVEQRIGRCHRYGQKYDVVVINFLNERNEADKRVLELLTEKFSLFNGVFGASDDVLGSIESGVDFEKRILAIYQECRTSAEIDAAFSALQYEMDEQIKTRLGDTQKALFEYFDEDVHQRLRLQLADAKAQLDRVGQRFWSLTRYILADDACFEEADLAFDLERSPRQDLSRGRYHLISKNRPVEAARPDPEEGYLYRLSHPLGEYVVATAKDLETASDEVVFNVSHHPTKLSVVEAMRGQSGYLTLNRLEIEAYDRVEELLFSGFTDAGASLDQEAMEKLFLCAGDSTGRGSIPGEAVSRMAAEAERHASATIHRSLEENSRYFKDAREKLEQWADDMVISAERALAATKEQLKALRRQARQAVTLEEQRQIQEQTQKLERLQRSQRQEIFKVEDEIMEKRDQLIDQLERRLVQRTSNETLFTIRWSVV